MLRLRLSLPDHFTEGSTSSLVDTPFEYTSSDEEGFGQATSDKHNQRVRISDIIDINLYQDQDSNSEDNLGGGLEESGEDDDIDSIPNISGCYDEGEDQNKGTLVRYDVPISPSRARLSESECESESLASQGSPTPDAGRTIDGNTLEDCIKMMDDISVGSHVSDEGFTKRSKSFLNLFFGTGSVCNSVSLSCNLIHPKISILYLSFIHHPL